MFKILGRKVKSLFVGGKIYVFHIYKLKLSEFQYNWMMRLISYYVL